MDKPVKEGRPLIVSYYTSRFDKGKEITVKPVSWPKLSKRLLEFKVTSESFEEYEQLPTLERLAIKDQGYFIGGEMNPPVRKAFNLQGRDLLVWDLDHIEPWDLELIRETYGEFEYLVHSSHSHSEDSPRVRLVMPTTRTVTPAEYEPLTRRLANRMGMDYFDDSTYQASRIMFWPSCSSDGDRYTEVNHGTWIDPDVILAEYDDPEDFAEWPLSSREGRVRPSALKAADPFTKPGIIGAFNRAYSIPEAIEAFGLPYVESGQGDGRYTFTLGTSADGAVYYPDDGHLYSHHDSDPAKGNHNAFDLVRLHKYADLDEGVDPESRMTGRPSYKAMELLAGKDKSVMAELIDDSDDFEDLGALEVEHKGETKTLTQNDLSFDAIRKYIDTCGNDHGRLTMEERDEVILRVAAAGAALDDGEKGVIALALKERYPYEGATKGGILNDFKARAKALKAGKEGEDVKDIQLELMHRFLADYYHNGDYLRRTNGQFWHYTGTHWEQIGDDVVSGQLADSLVILRTDPIMKKKFKALAAAIGEQQTSAVWSSLWRWFCANAAKDTYAIGEDPMGMLRVNLEPAINCLNGTVMFRGKGFPELRPSDPDDLFMSVVNVDYVPDAVCPRWDQFCQETFSKCVEPEEMQRHLEEFMGYIMSRGRGMRAWGLFFGPTGSGKSTVASILAELLGDCVKHASIANYGGSNSHATAGLIGKQLLVDDDYTVGTLLNDGFLKTVSEEKLLDANPKGKDEYTFVVRAVPLILSNNVPPTRDTSGGLYDRALVFPFSHSVDREARDPFLLMKLRAELPGILARCVRGLSRLVRRRDWEFPLDCSNAWQDWMERSNPVNTFVSQCLERAGKGSHVKAVDVWEVYQAWYYEESGSDSRRRLMRNHFYTSMDQVLSTPRRRDRLKGLIWDGWKITKEYEEKVISGDDF